MTEAKQPMADLDPALVKRLRDALPGTCTGARCTLPKHNDFSCPCADPVLHILGALGIPAAALNALYRGEAVVVNETTGLPYIESDALKARE